MLRALLERWGFVEKKPVIGKEAQEIIRLIKEDPRSTLTGPQLDTYVATVYGVGG